MKLRVLSDLHIEINGEPDFPDVECDGVVLAGDTGTGLSGIHWALRRFPGVPVVYVFGNHEYYGQNFFRLQRKAAEAAHGTNLTVLENTSVEWQGWRIFGATLWTDLAVLGDPESAVHSLSGPQGMNDYRRIRYDFGGKFPKLRPMHTAREHRRTLEALNGFLNEGGQRLIITHHAPSARSLPEEDRLDPCAPGYASALDAIVSASGARVWIHGHIHQSVDYSIGATRVLSNPLGYSKLGSSNPHFQADFLIELP